jgi:hypothetical protein
MSGKKENWYKTQVCSMCCILVGIKPHFQKLLDRNIYKEFKKTWNIYWFMIKYTANEECEVFQKQPTVADKLNRRKQWFFLYLSVVQYRKSPTDIIFLVGNT